MSKEHGAEVVDGVQVSSTLQCCHCGNHFKVVKGSGRTRGFCLKCNQVHCGDADCWNCVPFEKKMSLYEKGLILKL